MSKKPFKRRLLSYLLQFIILVVAIYAITKWQGKDLLPIKSSAPDFKLQSIDGKKYGINTENGKKVVLYFFSPWCRVCKLSSHNIVSLRNSKPKEIFTIYAIGLSWQNPHEIQRFAKDHNLNVPVLLGDGNIGSKYRIKAFPTIYVINEDGTVKERLVGYTTEIGLKLRLL